MKLDKDTCLGGRFNGKDILGIRLNGVYIYPIVRNYSIFYSFEGEAEDIIMTPSNQEYTVIESTFGSNPAREINFTTATHMESITFPSNTVHIISLQGRFNAYNFKQCGSLISVDLIQADTSNVTDMSEMFMGCSKLPSLNLSRFDTGKTNNMKGMFAACSNLTILDLSSFDTNNVTDMSQMFWGCSNLTYLNLSNFGTSNVENMNDMLFGCSSLQDLRLDNCNNATINSIITSGGFPTNDIEGVTRKIFINPDNRGNLTPPTNWKLYNCSTEEEIV